MTEPRLSAEQPRALAMLSRAGRHGTTRPILIAYGFGLPMINARAAPRPGGRLAFARRNTEGATMPLTSDQVDQFITRGFVRASARMQVHPPLATNVEAAVDMPPGIARIIGRRKADNEQAWMVTRTPSTRTDELIKGHVEVRGVYRAVEAFVVPGRMPDHRLRPCFGGICSRRDLPPHEPDTGVSDRARKSGA
jgi:hypothetical protein